MEENESAYIGVGAYAVILMVRFIVALVDQALHSKGWELVEGDLTDEQ